MTAEELLALGNCCLRRLTPDASIRDALELLQNNDSTAVPVLNDGAEFVGLFQEKNVVSLLRTHGADILDLKVHNSMSRQFATCSLNEQLDSIIDKMILHNVVHLPVLDEVGRFYGLVSALDVICFIPDIVRAQCIGAILDNAA